MSQAAQTAPRKTAIFELRSAQKGIRIKLAGEFIRLGRAEDNDVVLNDPSVSRYHLNLHISGGELTVEDVGSKTGVLVNGLTRRQAVKLNPGDRIQIGSTEFVLARAGEATPIPQRPVAKAPLTDPISGENVDPGRESLRKRLRLYTGAGIGLVVLYFALGTGGEKEVVKPQDLTSDQIEKTFQSGTYQADRFRSKSPSEIEAEATFLEALRDYNNGNFSRALVILDQALMQNREMEIASEYRLYAEARLNSQVGELMQDGQRSFSLLQYSRARSQFTTVLTILAEQIPGYLQMVAQRTQSLSNDRRPAQEQEQNLLDIPCEKTRHEAQCKMAVELIKQSRQRLGEEDTLK
jgi:pSer/pThr/pTyr-binding forkhead associated (FHA) protein